MRIIVSPQAFKGTLTAIDAASAMAEAAQTVHPTADILTLPIADGGDDSLNILMQKEGTLKSCEAVDAQGKWHDVQWGLCDDGLAVIELAKICGLAQLSPELHDPKTSSTYGLGHVLLEALDQGVRNFLITLGGSASNDAGTGALRALGARFLDKKRQEVPLGGLALKLIDSIDLKKLDPRLASCTFQLACDVQSPLTGPQGASLFYSLQKGATPTIAQELERAMLSFSQTIERELGRKANSLSYGGAAGGTAAGFWAILDAELHSGSELILNRLHFSSKLAGADLVLTGEGCFDAQTLEGKGPFAVAQAAQEKNVPCYMIAGQVKLTREDSLKAGFSSVAACPHHQQEPPYQALVQATQMLLSQ